MIVDRVKEFVLEREGARPADIADKFFNPELGEPGARLGRAALFESGH
jgi:hypothetical protein